MSRIRIENGASKPLDIAIIGGGIGGLSLLLGLLQHTTSEHIRPHLYESAAAFSEIGAGVGFGPNAVQAMKLVSRELYEAYCRIANNAEVVDLEGGRQAAVWHVLVMGMDGRTETNGLKAGDQFGEVYNTNFKKNVHRARLLDEMIRLLPGGGTGEGYVSFRKRCTEIDDLGEGKGVRVHFADGTSVEADAVVGCDGVKSRVRSILLKKIGDDDAAAAQFTEKYAYRGLIPMDEAVQALGPVARVSQIVCGYDGHMVCFPIDKGRTLNVVAFRSKYDGKWDQPEWVVESTVEKALEDFQDWGESIKKLLRGLRKPDVWALFEQPPAKAYCDDDGKICLLGDCAHASSPHQGAGAGMAMEDAAVLSRLLGSLERFDHQALRAALKAYNLVRWPRTQLLVSTSRDAGEMYDFQKDGIFDDAKKVSDNADERMRWIWDLNMEEHCQEAIRVMKAQLNGIEE